MGFMDWLRPNKFDAVTDLAMLSPYAAPGDLGTVIVEDLIGLDIPSAITRDVAMTVPAVARARALILAAVTQYPLVVLDDTDLPIAQQPSWTSRTDGPVPPATRTAAIVDDLIFYGASVLEVRRGAAGQALALDNVPRDYWRVHEGVMQFQTEPGKWRDAADSEYVFIEGYAGGLLQYGQATLRGALAIERAWQDRVANPLAAIVLHAATDDVTQDEANAYTKAWATARNMPGGAIGFLPQSINLEEYGSVQTDLFTEGRNAARTDVANLLNVPLPLLDGSLSTSTLTYSTSEGNRSRFATETIPAYTTPIEQALSGDNIVPRGLRTRFDRSGDYTPTPYAYGTPTDD